MSTTPASSPVSPAPSAPKTLAEKVWNDHLVVKGEDGSPDLIYIDLHLVHEVTSPQAFDGLRMAGRPGASPRPDDRDRGPQHPDTRDRQAHRRPDQPHPDRDPAQERRRVRRATALARRHRAGHRARRRPAARPHDAGHHRRLRRLAHLDPRRLRRDGVRYRHQRGRARARDADPAAPGVQDHGHHGRGRTAPRRDGERHHPRGDRQDRHRRRAGLRARVPRQRHPFAVDGRPHDDLQHVDRGGRPRRHGRARPDHLRLPEGPPARAGGRRLGCRRRLLGDAEDRRRRRVRRRGLPRRRTSSSRSSPGARTRPGRLAERHRPRPRGDYADPNDTASAAARARVHGPRRGHADEGHPRRRRLHGLVHELPHRRPARVRLDHQGPEEGRRRARHGRSGQRSRAHRGRGRGHRQDRRGVRRRVALRRLLDVPRDEPRPARPRRALRIHVQPQLRGQAGQGRAHAPRFAARRRCDRHPRNPEQSVGPRHFGARVARRAITLRQKQAATRATGGHAHWMSTPTTWTASPNRARARVTRLRH